MANGPPTPPPTTATELQDVARSSVPPASSSAAAAPSPASGSTPAPVPTSASASSTTSQHSEDAYQRAFPQIASLASQNDFEELIQVAETVDLTGDGNRNTSHLLITAPLVLAYLIVDNLPPALHALNRIPDTLAAAPLPQALWGLLASTGERKHANVYSRGESLLQMVKQPDFDHAELGTLLTAMVTTFIGSFRERTFVLLSKAYTSLPLPLAQTYLGLPVDQLLSAAEKSGWSYDASTQILSPSSGATSTPSLQGVYSSASSLTTFHLVADSVAQLEL